MVRDFYLNAHIVFATIFEVSLTHISSSVHRFVFIVLYARADGGCVF